MVSKLGGKNVVFLADSGGVVFTDIYAGIQAVSRQY